MNICLCIISEGWGGAETVGYELAKHLRDKGENVSVILNQEVVKYYANLDGVKLFNIGCMYNPLNLAKSIISPRSCLSERIYPVNRATYIAYNYLTEILCWIYFKRISKVVRQFLLNNHIDIIQAHMEKAILLVYNLGNLRMPTIVSTEGAHGLRGVIPVHPLLAPLVKWRARKIKQALNKMDMVREASAFMLDAWEGFGVPLKNKSVVIPNGINLSEFKSSSKSSLKLEGDFNLLFPGGAKWVKGGDLLISALAKVRQEIPNVHLYIALDVPKDHLLRRMVNDLGLAQNVTFVGFLPKEEFRRLLNSVDLLALPSRIEAFAIVFVEAMASGKPIIATNTGGIPEVIKNGRNGILVNPNENEIASAILHLHNNENLRKQISKHNVQDAEKLDWDNIVDQYRDLYRSLL